MTKRGIAMIAEQHDAQAGQRLTQLQADLAPGPTPRKLDVNKRNLRLKRRCGGKIRRGIRKGSDNVQLRIPSQRLYETVEIRRLVLHHDDAETLFLQRMRHSGPL